MLARLRPADPPAPDPPAGGEGIGGLPSIERETMATNEPSAGAKKAVSAIFGLTIDPAGRLSDVTIDTDRGPKTANGVAAIIDACMSESLAAAEVAKLCRDIGEYGGTLDNAADLLRRAVEGELEDYERPEAIEHAEMLADIAATIRGSGGPNCQPVPESEV